MTDQQLLQEIQLAVLEPADGGASWPSEVWTRDEVLGYLNGGIWQLLKDTELQVTRTELAVAGSATSIALPADWIATCSGVWRDGTTNVRTPLGPVGAFEGDAALPGWEATGGLPLGLVDLDSATLTLRLIPTPLSAGTLELLYVARTAAMTGAGVTLPIPDDYLSGVKYSTLGMMLRKVGRLLDPERAAYCEQRYDLVVAVTGIILGGWS